ncbi:MAG: acyl-CoA dehydrogenase, partial [Pseudomonadota bacterium]
MALDTPSLAARAEDTSAILPNLIDICAEALDGAEALLTEARSVLRDKVTAKDRVSGKMLEAHQQATHGLAWTATYVEALRQMLSWARRQD